MYIRTGQHLLAMNGNALHTRVQTRVQAIRNESALAEVTVTAKRQRDALQVIKSTRRAAGCDLYRQKPMSTKQVCGR